MMQHSKKFALVKKYYDTGLWNLTMVRNAVHRWITESEYTEIIGLQY